MTIGSQKHRPHVLFSRIDHRDRPWMGCECQRCTPTLRPATARFWVVYSGGLAAKVKVRAGETVSHCDGGPTDEGYSYTTRTWHFDGDGVSLEVFTDARDCDGRIQNHHKSYCNFSDLMAGYCAADYGSTERDSDTYNLRFPRWNQVQAGQRDFAAEAAGY